MNDRHFHLAKKSCSSIQKPHANQICNIVNCKVKVNSNMCSIMLWATPYVLNLHVQPGLLRAHAILWHKLKKKTHML